MKVTERSEPARNASGSGASRFREALRGARHDPGRRVPRPTAGRAAGDTPVPTLGKRRATADRLTGVLRERRDVFGDAERQAQPAAPPRPASPPATSRVDSAPELRALVRTLPVVIEAARVREGAPLSLALGRALSVDLRRGADGLEVVLRPDAALGRAADAELPALIAALRERGIAVARAEVRAQPNGNPPARRPPR
jgi:hypothetical protein